MIDSTSSHVAGLLGRAGLAGARGAEGWLEAAAALVGGDPTAILEVTGARWQTEARQADVIAALTREGLVLVEARREGLLRTAGWSARLVRFAEIKDLIETDDAEWGGPSVFFLGVTEDKHMVLTWAASAERDRMNPLLFQAHQGRFRAWGLQLDPDDYAEDFDRYYTELCRDGPDRPIDLYGWVEARHGEYDLANALGYALEWRRCVLDDLSGRQPSSRVSRIGFPYPWLDAGPSARRLILDQGKELYAEGLLSGPYDERSFGDDEPLVGVDAGPARLIALMTCAALARELNDAQAAELADAARAGIPVVPASVLSPDLRERWSVIGPALPPSAPRDEPV
jgi:hypothetical protein